MIDSYKVARAAIDAVNPWMSNGHYDSEMIRAVQRAIAPMLADMTAPAAPKIKQRSLTPKTQAYPPARSIEFAPEN